MVERYALDTSAVIAYFSNEAGADRVEGILVSAETRRNEVYASFMTPCILSAERRRRP